MERKKMEDLNLTKMEQNVLQELIDSLYAEPGFSDVCPQQLSKYTGIPMKQIRGVIGSLVKKDIIWLGDNDCQGEDFLVIVYLHERYWYLHPDKYWNEYDVSEYL